MSVPRCSLAAGVLLLLFASTAPAQNAPQDYPQWRGKTGDGSASAFSAPASWPETLTRKWKVDVGDGYATPIVVGNVVYAFTRRDGNEVLTALDAATGAGRWQTSYPAPYTVSTAAAAHGAGPKATPAFHDGKLFTLGISGIVAAFDASSGKLLWRTDAPAEHPYFSAASSPLGDAGVVLAHPGNYGPLTAFDANTGQDQMDRRRRRLLRIASRHDPRGRPPGDHGHAVERHRRVDHRWRRAVAVSVARRHGRDDAGHLRRHGHRQRSECRRGCVQTEAGATVNGSPRPSGKPKTCGCTCATQW